MNRKATLILINGLACLGFLALPYVLSDSGFARLGDLLHDSHEQRNLISHLLTIGFFYLNYYVLIPRFFLMRHYVAYGLCVVTCFLMMQGALTAINQQGVPYTSTRPVPAPPDRSRNRPLRPEREPPRNGRPPAPDQSPPPGLPSEISQTLFLFVLGLLLSLALRINNRWRETEREKLQTELSYLKAQINPHFLFNTLNSIYSLAIIESPATADALVQLSSFLRYVITEGNQDKVALSHELAYIGHYVALQKLRLADTVPITYRVEGHPNGLLIAPLLLISFIENAFKYGVSPQEPSEIEIRISVQQHTVRCYVMNRKVRVFQPTAVTSGIGLPNTKERLQLLYPNQHDLIISDEPDRFTVDLSLTLA